MDRVTVPEAAHILGIKEESVRKRISRGKLRADKDPEGGLLVYVGGTQTVRDAYGDRSVPDEDEQPDLARELLEEMHSRISSLEYQLSEERGSATHYAGCGLRASGTVCCSLLHVRCHDTKEREPSTRRDSQSLLNFGEFYLPRTWVNKGKEESGALCLGSSQSRLLKLS